MFSVKVMEVMTKNQTQSRLSILGHTHGMTPSPPRYGAGCWRGCQPPTLHTALADPWAQHRGVTRTRGEPYKLSKLTI